MIADLHRKDPDFPDLSRTSQKFGNVHCLVSEDRKRCNQ